MSSSPSVKLHPDFQLPEVKLDNARKLDLSLWREDDDEDKDSSIDLPTSPPGATNSSNTKTIVHAQPQSSSSLQPPRHFPLPSSASDFTDDEEDDEASDTSEPHLSLSHITIIKPNKSHPIAPSATSARDDHQHDHQDERKNSPPPPDPLGHEGENNNSNNTTKGGVKKVEFTGIQLDQMSWDKKGAGNTSKRSDSLEKAGTTGQIRSRRRSSRGKSGVNLFNEIRKMSLASQDAEEEKKKQSGSPGGGGGGGQSSAGKNKSRRGRRKRRREEEYTDKDRAAAVTLGSRDIKQSLKAKKKRERKMRLSIDFLSSEEYLSSLLVIEASYQLKVKGQPNAALATLNKALELQPSHKGALVARSQCHLKLGDANSALKDAQTSFDEHETTFMQGLYQYAEALYQLGEFEKALIAFHQGFRLRKDMDGFRIGVQKSQEAIRRAIGDRSATKMRNLDEILSIIEELDESKKRAVSTAKEEDILMNIIKRRYGDKLISHQKSHKPNKNHWITREVLGQMYLDKDFLAKFIHRPDVKEQMGNSEALRENAKEALKYLESREKFWRQQNPLYARKTTANIMKQNSLLSQVSACASTLGTPKLLQLKGGRQQQSSSGGGLSSGALNKMGGGGSSGGMTSLPVKGKVDVNNNDGKGGKTSNLPKSLLSSSNRRTSNV